MGAAAAIHRVTATVTSHAEAVLTAAALPIMLIAAAPAEHVPTTGLLVLAVLSWIPLLARTRWPLPVAALVAALDTVHLVVVSHISADRGILPAATMLALYTVGARCTTRITWLAALSVAAVQYVTALITASNRPAEDLLYLNWAVLGALIGLLVRERKERIGAAEARADDAERSKASEARRQVTEERMRIARELHDVLAHHITTVNAQASVAQYLLQSDLDAAATALAGIADNTRAALDELRATLGLLRSDTAERDSLPSAGRAPTPDSTQLPDLVEHHRAAGATITSSVSGIPYQLTAAADLGLYRIAQEALTNASKHAPHAPVELSINWDADAVTLTVLNAASDRTPRPGAGTGHGLMGMRERAAAAGGTVQARAVGDGGFQVVAWLPKAGRSDAARTVS